MDTLISDQEKFVYHEADEVGGVTVGLIQMAMGNDAGENIRTAEKKVRGAIAAGANIICLPGRYATSDQIIRWIDIWLSTPYSTEERHKKRVAEISEIENEFCK